MDKFNRIVDIYRSSGCISVARALKSYIWRKIGMKFRSVYRITSYKMKYGDAAPNPYELIHIDPDRIKYMIVPALRYEYPRSGTYVLDGDWDQLQTYSNYFSTKKFKENNNSSAFLPFSEYGLYQSMCKHFNDDVPWKETKWYQYLMSISDELSYDSPEEVYERFEELDRLYTDIREEGYKTQRELQERGQKCYFSQLSTDEILVDIDRNGRFIFEDGRHRLAIAKILGLEQIPVRVLVRHTRWQEIRRSIISNNEVYSNLQTPFEHPDLQALLS